MSELGFDPGHYTESDQSPGAQAARQHSRPQRDHAEVAKEHMVNVNGLPRSRRSGHEPSHRSAEDTHGQTVKDAAVSMIYAGQLEESREAFEQEAHRASQEVAAKGMESAAHDLIFGHAYADHLADLETLDRHAEPEDVEFWLDEWDAQLAEPYEQEE